MAEEKNFNVDEALKRLSEINQKLSEDQSLDESIALYHEGMKLVKECDKYLKGVEQQLEIIGETVET